MNWQATTTSNSIALTPHLRNNSTSNSTSNIKKQNNNNEVAISGGNLSATLTRLSTSNNYNYDNNAKPLSISIQSSQNIVNGRGTSTVTAIAYDATTDKKIDNAVVKVKITFTSNDTSKEIVGHNGEVTYSADIKPNSKDNSNIGF
jgi:Tfp pilus assembly protein FimT